MSRAVLHKAEAIGADDRTRMDDDAISNADIFINDDLRVKSAVISDCCVLADIACGFDDRRGAYRSTGLHHHVGADLHTLA